MTYPKLLGLAVAASMTLATPASGAEQAVIDLQVKGAGTMRFDAQDGYADQRHVGQTCGGVPGAELPQANLANPTESVQFLCSNRFTMSRCPEGQGPDCLLQATVKAREPNTPQLTTAEATANPVHWMWSGWMPGPCQGQGKTCTLTYGNCIADACRYEPPMTLTAVFRDIRAPTASFACRNASGAYDSSTACAARPPKLVTDPSGAATFHVRSDEYFAKEYSRIECRRDEAPDWAPCQPAPPPAAPGTYRVTGMSDGAHVLRVRAVDPSGNVQRAEPATAAWTQRYPPVTAITHGPPEGTSIAVRKPRFRFASATEHRADHECRIDDAAWKPCEQEFTPPVSLLDGPHAFSVRGIRNVDGAAVHELDPPVRRFTVDLVAPEAVITNGPEDGLVTTNRTARFRFETDPPEPGITFTCALDAAVPTPCDDGAEDFLSLSAGDHTFSVTAIDAAGNAQQRPATRSWTVIADADGDGFYAPDNDCNDANPAIRPGATEIPGNGVDENCDGADPPNLDLDGDGARAAPQGRDCDDADAGIRPGATDVPGNGVDEDCDGVDTPDRDRDRDGSLAAPAGRDCDDGDAARNPGAEDVPENGVDEDCDEVDAVFPLIGVRFEARWQPFRTYTKVVSLEVLRVPAGSTVSIRCRGGCKRTSRRVLVRRDRARLDLARYVGRRLRAGATLEVRVSRPGTSTEGRRWRIKRRRAPSAQGFCVLGGERGPC